MKIVFIHHSVGRNIIKYSLKEDLKKYNKLLTDIDYNKIGVHDENNNKIKGLIIPNDKTNPEDYLKTFKNNNSELIEYLKSFDLVILKSCYTTFYIKSEKQLEERLKAIEKIGDIVSKLFNKVIIITPPPLSRFRYLFTNKEYYKKIVEQYKLIKESDNLRVFDLHYYLSNNDKWLHSKYQRILFFDSHPNRVGLVFIKNKLLEFIKHIE